MILSLWNRNFANTFAFNGSFSSQYFGEKFDGDKVEKTVRYEIRIFPPQSYNINGKLHVKIELIQMKDFFGRNLGDNIDINANARNNGIRKSVREAFNKKNIFFPIEHNVWKLWKYLRHFGHSSCHSS